MVGSAHGVHSMTVRQLADRSSVALGAALAAALLAGIPLVLSRLDGDSDLDPFFVLLVAAALAVAILPTVAPTQPAAKVVAWLIVVVWFAAAAVIAALLFMYQTACACSRPDLSHLPPPRTYAGLPATAYHLLATYGGGLLVAASASLSSRPQRVDPPA